MIWLYSNEVYYSTYLCQSNRMPKNYAVNCSIIHVTPWERHHVQNQLDDPVPHHEHEASPPYPWPSPPWRLRVRRSRAARGPTSDPVTSQIKHRLCRPELLPRSFTLPDTTDSLPFMPFTLDQGFLTGGGGGNFPHGGNIGNSGGKWERLKIVVFSKLVTQNGSPSLLLTNKF